ncbi:MAG: ATP synthase F1 subunit delta [Acidobacteriota bacterium]
MTSSPSRAVDQYARALADVLESRPERERSRTHDELMTVAEALRQTPDLKAFLDSPVVEGERKIELLRRVLVGAQALTLRVLQVLVERGRAGLLAEICAAYEHLRDERGNVLVAEVTSAVPLGGEAVRRYERALRESTGREVKLRFEQDPSLMGGMRTRIGSRVYDSSVRARLDMLRRELLGD